MVDASLLRAIVDQFVGRTMHPPGDVKQFEQLALGFIDILDSETVARVALPLCFHPETPQTIFARLFDKGGAAAALAFQFAPFVAPRDMIATAEHGPTAFAAAIARRRVLDRETIAALASRSEPEILRALAGNLSAHLDAGSRRALVLAARDDATLARMLLDRDDLDIDPEPLFLAATRLERKAIVLTACRRALTSGTTETPRRADAAFVARLEEAALRRDRDAMAALLADALDCRKDRARALIADSHGEALALALSAIGVSIEQATHILQGVAPAKAQNPEAAGALDHAAFRRNRLNADDVIDSKSLERALREKPASTFSQRALVALMRSTPQRAAARLVSAIVGAARAERETARRPSSREEAPVIGKSRGASGQNGTLAPRKLDQSA